MQVRERRRQGGAAMFVAVLMLVLMGWLGLAAMDTASRDQQLAGFRNRSRSAFYAAEAGAAAGRALVRSVGSRNATPALPTTSLGDAALYARWPQQPQYMADPNFPNPIVYVEDAGPAGGMNLNNPRFVNTLWRINVQGVSYDGLGGVWDNSGSVARLEVMETKILSAGYR